MRAVYLSQDRVLRLGLRAIAIVVAATIALVLAGGWGASRAGAASDRNGPETKHPSAKSARAVQLQQANTGKPAARPAESPIIAFEKRIYNFGRVMAGKVVRHDFRFRNTGKQSLLITEVKLSCGCATAGPYDDKLLPGAAAKIPISMTTRRLAGKIQKSIIVSSNDPGLPAVRLQMVGEVITPVTVDPPSVFFRLLQDDLKQQRVLKIVNNTDTPLELTYKKQDSDPFQIDLKSVKPNQEFELTVTALSPFPAGSVRKSIFLKTNLSEMPFVTIVVQGFRPPPVTVVPKQVWLRLPVSKNFRKRIFVRRSDRQPLKLSELKVTGENLTISLADAQPVGQAYWIILEGPAGYELPKGGERVTFSTDDPSMPQVTVPVDQHRRPATRRLENARRPTRP